jgi:urease accessory protein
MQKAHDVIRKGGFAPGSARDHVFLDFDRRYRRRCLLTSEGKQKIMLDLADATHIRDGDALVLADGSLVIVVAEPEELLQITAPDAEVLMRIAWHLGNRHLPTQLLDGCLRIRADNVIATMVLGLGGQVASLLASFDPEGGAYRANPAEDGAQNSTGSAAISFGFSHE